MKEFEIHEKVGLKSNWKEAREMRTLCIGKGSLKHMEPQGRKTKEVEAGGDEGTKFIGKYERIKGRES